MLNKENSTDKERKGFIKFICWGVLGVCILLVIIQVADYCRLTKLEKEAKRIEEEYWNKWFDPADDESIKQAIEEWNEIGVISFVEDDDIDEKLKGIEEKRFYYKNDSIFINTREWLFINPFNGMRQYSNEEITDAMLFLLYGKRGLENNNKVYKSTYTSVTDIPRALFCLCSEAIDIIICCDQGDTSIYRYWCRKTVK